MKTLTRTFGHKYIYTYRNLPLSSNNVFLFCNDREKLSLPIHLKNSYVFISVQVSHHGLTGRWVLIRYKDLSNIEPVYI